ncbi:hypothetical protein PTKIN_Ptkin11bG0176900 [Pterospermum kingtungense]
MAEFAASAAANTLGNLATDYASSYVSYFFRFGKIVEDFKNRKNQLELKKDRVKNDVDEAIRQTEVIEKDVQDWLTKAEKELGEAQNLEDEIKRSIKCFNWCPNWGWRYCLSKKVAKKTLSISKLLETSDFPRVGRRAPLEGIEFLLSNHHFLPSQSSNAALSGIIKALNSDGVNMVGLYGMPGVGKTTLAEQVGKHAREGKLFGKVVIFTVSQIPNIHKIQDKIAEALGLKFEATTDEGRAEELLRRLNGEQKILIIIDDVWDRLELKHIGIPLGEDHKGCKILLTTRRQQVCTLMNCEEKFPLDILSESEAWALFKDNAGLENAFSTLIDVAKEVAGECKGLPLAIVTMARALKDETLDVWRVVNKRLKDSRHSENQDVCGGIYSRLQISYDYLKGNNSRSCLLLCSLFPEDYEIKISELTMYGIGQGMFDDVDSIEDARREMRLIQTNLQKCGLLLETSFAEEVKMHDVVRDFVHWITLEGENMSLVRSGLKKWPGRESLECCIAISLIDNEINNFPDSLEFPKLKTFLLDRVMYKIDVPSWFLQGMKVLKVLVLRNVSLSLEDLQFLPNLRTLRLEACALQNVSSLGNLKKLEILVSSMSLQKENCEELFPGLMGLTTLKLLDISDYPDEVWTLPKNFLPSLVQLEELSLPRRMKWARISEESADTAGISELFSLSRLTQLSPVQLSPECIPNKFVFPPLQRYDVYVHDDDDYDDDQLLHPGFNPYWRASRRLTIKKFTLNTFKELFCNVEKLDLVAIMDLEYLIDRTNEQGPKSSFSNLVSLTLDNMICFKELCHGRPPIGFLHKLEDLTIRSCTNLVFVGATLPNLKILRVERCGQMQAIFEEIQTPLVLSSLTFLHLESLPELKGIWKGPTYHVSLQSLKYVMVSRCNKLKSVFSLSVAQTLVHLQVLDVSDCDGVEQVFYCEEETDDGEDITLPQLHTLELKGLRSLRKFYSENYFLKLPSLKKLAVRNFGQLTHFKDKDELEVTAWKDELEVSLLSLSLC